MENKFLELYENVIYVYKTIIEINDDVNLDNDTDSEALKQFDLYLQMSLLQFAFYDNNVSKEALSLLNDTCKYANIFDELEKLGISFENDEYLINKDDKIKEGYYSNIVDNVFEQIIDKKHIREIFENNVDEFCSKIDEPEVGVSYLYDTMYDLYDYFGEYDHDKCDVNIYVETYIFASLLYVAGKFGLID